jgi:hypothetical protein
MDRRFNAIRYPYSLTLIEDHWILSFSPQPDEQDTQKVRKDATTVQICDAIKVVIRGVSYLVYSWIFLILLERGANCGIQTNGIILS